MKNSSNLNISCKVVFSLNKWNKKVGSPSSFGRKRPFISLNSSASIENLSSSERARARARANHAINDAQKGCAMQLNGITLRQNLLEISQQSKYPREGFHQPPSLFHDKGVPLLVRPRDHYSFSNIFCKEEQDLAPRVIILCKSIICRIYEKCRKPKRTKNTHKQNKKNNLRTNKTKTKNTTIKIKQQSV